MSRRSALVFSSLAFCCLQLAAVWGESPPAPADQQLAVLRNGEVIRGQISRQGDRYRIALSNGEVWIRAGDVELVCRNLDDAYAAKCGLIIPDRADDHLDLAEWCLRQNLPGDAAREISAAMALDPRNPRISMVDRRLQQALTPVPAPAANVASHPAARVTGEDLDRMVRSLPPLAVETFSTSIQPLLISGCATAGCHGPGAQSNFALIRIPPDRFANRRLTQRNLQSTLAWLDFADPTHSRLLTVAAHPHAAASAPFDPQGTKYRELLMWVGLVTERGEAIVDGAGRPKTLREARTDGAALGQIDPNSPASADDDARPPRPTHHYSHQTKPATPRGDAATEGQPLGPERSRTPIPPAARHPPAYGAPTGPPPSGDPYDPGAFNRQNQPPAGHPSAAPSQQPFAPPPAQPSVAPSGPH